MHLTGVGAGVLSPGIPLGETVAQHHGAGAKQVVAAGIRKAAVIIAAQTGFNLGKKAGFVRLLRVWLFLLHIALLNLRPELR